ncbi:hypothetical protein CLOM_g10438 [Closterium sp. NIES-68]|nr:hypothetical protein CLOM_g10438 [Closterium sp. NIES-68]GJP74018.1 hypothetical protein CLOP_g4670 [Closterium sp. NIES-67]
MAPRWTVRSQRRRGTTRSRRSERQLSHSWVVVALALLALAIRPLEGASSTGFANHWTRGSRLYSHLPRHKDPTSASLHSSSLQSIPHNAAPASPRSAPASSPPSALHSASPATANSRRSSATPALPIYLPLALSSARSPPSSASAPAWRSRVALSKDPSAGGGRVEVKSKAKGKGKVKLPGSAPSVLSAADRGMLLTRMNDARLAVPSASLSVLTWNDALASSAQQQAANQTAALCAAPLDAFGSALPFVMTAFPMGVPAQAQKIGTANGSASSSAYGMGWYGFESAAASPAGNTPSDAVNAWLYEKQNYDSAADTCAAGEQCSNYRQIIWKAATAVGCGMVACSEAKAPAPTSLFSLLCLFDSKASSSQHPWLASPSPPPSPPSPPPSPPRSPNPPPSPPPPRRPPPSPPLRSPPSPPPPARSPPPRPPPPVLRPPSPPPPSPPPARGASVLAGGARGELLALVNRERAAASLSAITWSDALASSAQQWAANQTAALCAAPLDPFGSLLPVAATTLPAASAAGSTTMRYGMGWYGFESAAASPAGNTPSDAVNAWLYEKQNYDPSTKACSASDTCDNYRQIIGSTTTAVGCGMINCPEAKAAVPTSLYILLCYFDPPGYTSTVRRRF